MLATPLCPSLREHKNLPPHWTSRRRWRMAQWYRTCNWRGVQILYTVNRSSRSRRVTYVCEVSNAGTSCSKHGYPGSCSYMQDNTKSWLPGNVESVFGRSCGRCGRCEVRMWWMWLGIEAELEWMVRIGERGETRRCLYIGKRGFGWVCMIPLKGWSWMPL